VLTLTRRAGESVVINPDTDQQATVTVLEVHGGKVRLGFAADRRVPIVRTEVLDRDREDREAA